MVLFDFQHVWSKSGHFAIAVNKIDTLDGTSDLSWYGVVNSFRTHLGEVALILLYLLKNCPCLCAKYKCVN